MENQHKKIKGYRDLSQQEIEGMNHIKELEKVSAELFKIISALEEVDKRSLALARAQLQGGFMWFVRAIAKPADPFED